MIEISYLGHACFRIAGKETSIVTDPYDEVMVGLKLPKVEADVVTVSHHHKDHDNTQKIKGDFLCFDTPGEYETKNAEIIGIDSYHDKSQGSERGKNTIFVFLLENVRICHLGDLGCSLSSEQLEIINGVDVLMVPVGGVFTIDSKEAAKVVSEIAPKLVIPMHYQTPKMKDLEPLENFLNEIGKEPKRLDSLKIKGKELGEDLEVIVLNNKGLR